MDIKQASKELAEIKLIYCGTKDEALDMAIKALKDKEVADSEQEAYEILVCLQEEMRQKGREQQYNSLQVAIDILKRRM